MKTGIAKRCAGGCFAVLLCGAVVPAAAEQSPHQALGEKVFNASCKSCHDTGKPQNDAPQLNEQGEWKDRYGKGLPDLYKSAIDGFTAYFAMPPRGGNAALSDDEVKAAVDYLLQRAGVR